MTDDSKGYQPLRWFGIAFVIYQWRRKNMSVYESELNLNYIPTGATEHGAEQTYETARPAISNDAKAVHRRRRWTHEEKKAIVAETEGPGASISGVARKYGIAPRLLFSWRRQLSEEMALTTRSGAKIVPISMVKELEKRIVELEEQLAAALASK
jgi:transposase-like protein